MGYTCDFLTTKEWVKLKEREYRKESYFNTLNKGEIMNSMFGPICINKPHVRKKIGVSVSNPPVKAR